MASHSVNLSVVARCCSSIYTMFSRILALFVVSLACIENAKSAPSAVSKARQYIPSLPGFVPVYIRPGDTPLEDINPDLAEAFRSYAEKHARLAFGRAHNAVTPDGDEGGRIIVSIGTPKAVTKRDDISVIALDEDEVEDGTSTTSKPGAPAKQHIQKIPSRT